MGFFDSKRKIKANWSSSGIKFIAENDRIYDNILSGKISSIDKNSSNYLSGKFLFRTFAVAVIQVGIIFEKKLDQEDLDELHQMLSMLSMLGTNDMFSVFETEHGIKLDEIPVEKIEPLHGRGAEFMDETVKAFAVYCVQTDPLHVSDELIKLYCEALSHSIKDLDQESFVPQAMATFSAARKAIGQ